MSSEDRERGPLAILGWMVGLAAGWYTGLNLVLAVIACVLAFGVAKSVLPATRKPFLPAIAVLAGHALWMLVGGLLLGQVGAVIADVVAFFMGVAWLAIFPGIAGAVVITLGEGICLVVHVYQITNTTFADPTSKGLVAHMLLRGTAIALVWKGVLESRRQVKAAIGLESLVALLKELLGNLEASGEAARPHVSSLKPLVEELESAARSQSNVDAINAILIDLDPVMALIREASARGALTSLVGQDKVLSEYDFFRASMRSARSQS